MCSSENVRNGFVFDILLICQFLLKSLILNEGWIVIAKRGEFFFVPPWDRSLLFWIIRSLLVDVKFGWCMRRRSSNWCTVWYNYINHNPHQKHYQPLAMWTSIFYLFYIFFVLKTIAIIMYRYITSKGLLLISSQLIGSLQELSLLWL